MTPLSPDTPPVPSPSLSDPPSALARLRVRFQRFLDDGATTAAEQQLRLVLMVGGLAILMTTVWTVAFAALGLWPRLPLTAALLIGATLSTLAARRRPALAAPLLAGCFIIAPLADAATGAGLLHATVWIVAFGVYGSGLTAGPRVTFSLSSLALIGATALLLRDLGASPDSGALWTAYAVFVLGIGVAGAAGCLYARLAARSVDQLRLRADALGDRLRSSEARHQSLLDRLPLGVFRSTPDGRILDANPAFAEMVGASSPEAACALGSAAYYADPAQRDAFVEAMARDGAVNGFLLEWRALDGASRLARVDARAVLADGEAVYEGTARDVTDEQHARSALARVQARQSAVLRAASDAILVLDAEGCVAFASPAIEPLLGRTPDAVRSLCFLDLVHPDERVAAGDALALALGRPGAEPALEIALEHVDGHAVLVEGVWSATRAAEGGRVVSFRDVTERKRAEVALRQAHIQAEEGSRLKTALLANVSHEVRTPLTAILGFSEILASELGDSDHREFVDLIAESGERLMTTLSSVLDLAQLDAGRVELAPEPRRVAAPVVEAARLFRTAAEAKRVQLSVHVEAPGAEAALDGDAFERVLRHLVGNAVKFTERGRVTVTVRSAGGRVIVDIADTGIGIAESFLPRLFEAFEQESAGTGRDFEGVGVGLAVSRRLVERMGGEIRIDSRKGAGTTVTLSFLRTDLGPDERTVDERPVALVLDDNPQARFVAERLLVERFRVRSARSAGALFALADELALAGEPAAITLLDIHLGAGPSGDDVMRALRERPAYAAAPILAVTAYALPGDRERFLAGGFDGYLTKPYTRAELFAAVDRALLARRATAAPRALGASRASATAPPRDPAPTARPSSPGDEPEVGESPSAPAPPPAEPLVSDPTWALPRPVPLDEFAG